MEQFRYSSIDLEGSSFRLIRLLGGSSPAVECELFDAWLNEDGDGIPYEALSYTWGRMEKTGKIILNKKIIHVTVNLEEALHHLRSSDSDRILWVDAICIDQDNAQERGHQVQQMGKIYKGADQVLVWLGRGNLQTDLFMDFLIQLHKDVVKSGRDLGKSDSALANDGSMYPTIRDAGEGLILEVRKGLKNMLEHPWFWRVWILQEISNARRAIVVCGRRYVSARTFAITPPLLGVKPDQHCQAVLDIMPGSLRTKSWWSQDRRLYNLLLKFRGAHATEQRDRIYAIMGMSSDASSSSILYADYTKTDQEVVGDTVSFLLSPEGPGYPLGSCIHWSWEEFLESLETLTSTTFACVVQKWDAELVKAFLKRNDLDINWKDEHSDTPTPLELAIQGGHATVLELLCKQENLNINLIQWNSKTPLCFAAEQGYTALVEQLINRSDVDVNSKDSVDDQTPLCCAAANGHVETVALLLQCEDIDLSARGLNKKTALCCAAENGHTEVVRMLLQHSDFLVNGKSGDSETALCCAAENGHAAVINVLLGSKHIHVNAKGKYGGTALSWAIRQHHEDVARMLLSCKDIDVNISGTSGRTPLCHAAKGGHVADVQLLLDQKSILVNVTDSEGKTALYHAAEQCHDAVVKILLEREDVSVNLGNQHLQTPLWITTFRNHEAAAILLLQRKDIDVNAANIYKQSPLWVAANYGAISVAKLLIQRKDIDLDSKNMHECTPLEIARLRSNKEMVRLLTPDPSSGYAWTKLSF